MINVHIKMDLMKIKFLWVLSILCLSAVWSYPMDYTEEYFDQRIDNFNFKSHGDRTFKHRYFYNDSFWDKENGGPILFYAGNEGSLDSQWYNGGFVLQLGSVLKGLVLFAEHRFYGRSLPFGKVSFDVENIGLLSIEQALADYAFLIKDIKEKFDAEDVPVIAFGVSYGGILAAYMRFKFPNLIEGAISSSAPMYMAAGIVSSSEFFQSITKTFRDVSKECEDHVRAGFAQIAKWSEAGQSGLDKISEVFLLCKPLSSKSDYDHFLRWARNAFGQKAMANNPVKPAQLTTPRAFMSNIPTYPVNAICERLNAEQDKASGLRIACGMFYNSTGHKKCFDIYEEYLYCSDPTSCNYGFDSKAWDYQCCTEFNLEGGTDGVKDMFPVLPFNARMRDDHCLKTWNVIPRRDWLNVMYWGKDISSASNVVFSNGDLDPWAVGGVLEDVSDSMPAIIIKGVAHGFDLSFPTLADPPSLVEARILEMRNIEKWIAEYYEKKNSI